MSRLSLILLFCYASACCSNPVRDRAASERVAAQAALTLPAVAQRLGVPVRAVKIELSDGPLEFGHLGAVLGGRIVMARAAVDHPAGAWMLAHEAVHVFLPDELKMLPAAVQEGLADFIACQVEPGSGVERIEQLQKTLASGARNGWGLMPVDAFALSMQQIYVMSDPFRQQFVYALGFAVASRLGLERLTELCHETRLGGRSSVLATLLCAHAGLDDTTLEGWTLAAPSR